MSESATHPAGRCDSIQCGRCYDLSRVPATAARRKPCPHCDEPWDGHDTNCALSEDYICEHGINVNRRPCADCAAHAEAWLLSLKGVIE